MFSKSSLRIVIVDDEFLPLEQLRRLLVELGHQVIGAYLNLQEAENHVRRDPPDLVIVDIFMNRSPSGLHWAQNQETRSIPYLLISGGDPREILQLVSKTDARGMLHKPIRKRELFIRLESLRIGQALSDPTHDPRLKIRHAGKSFLLSVHSICYVESSQNDYIVYTATRRFVTEGSLAKLSQALPQKIFVRVHRSFLINMGRVKNYSARTITLDTGVQIPIGRTYRASLMKLIDQHSI